MQTFACGHETARRPPGPGIAGVGWIAQVPPSQRSARGRELPPVAANPTAVQTPRFGQDTPCKELEVAPGAFGVG
jgi:hypothetical protein